MLFVICFVTLQSGDQENYKLKGSAAMLFGNVYLGGIFRFSY
ncbi:hypothetical protein [uncultured Flavobacterium sp.]